MTAIYWPHTILFQAHPSDHFKPPIPLRNQKSTFKWPASFSAVAISFIFIWPFRWEIVGKSAHFISLSFVAKFLS